MGYNDIVQPIWFPFTSPSGHYRPRFSRWIPNGSLITVLGGKLLHGLNDGHASIYGSIKYCAYTLNPYRRSLLIICMIVLIYFGVLNSEWCFNTPLLDVWYVRPPMVFSTVRQNPSNGGSNFYHHLPRSKHHLWCFEPLLLVFWNAKLLQCVCRTVPSCKRHIEVI